MATHIDLTKRVTKLEEQVKTTDERVDDLEAWLTDESALREIDEKRIELLEAAEKIRQRARSRRR